MENSKIYNRKPEKVCAIKWTDDNWDDVVKFCTTDFCTIKKLNNNEATLKSMNTYLIKKGEWLTKTLYTFNGKTSDFVDAYCDDEVFEAYFAEDV